MVCVSSTHMTCQNWVLRDPVHLKAYTLKPISPPEPHSSDHRASSLLHDIVYVIPILAPDMGPPSPAIIWCYGVYHWCR